MPYSVTIARAIAVAFSMSLPAPVVGSWKTSSSAARPPSAYASVSIISARVCVYLQERLAALHIRGVHGDLPVEPARPQQRRVEDVRPVGRRDQDHAALGVEAVHLDQQLVEGLLALVVPPAEPGAPVPADRVDLVDEDDRRRVGLGLLEQVAYPGGADTDEHLDEVGAGDGVERYARLAGHGPGEQRLTGTGRAEQQYALGDLRAERLVLGRVLEEVLDLVQFLDRLVGPGHVGERGLRRVLGAQLRLGLAE